MTQNREFSFSDQSVARSYDSVLVPLLFEPWAKRLADDHEPWGGRQVLDLATGTGIVARILADRVGSEGRVIGSDINGAMLALARHRCADAPCPVEFKEGPAQALDLPNASVDTVVCQQGFQFFPDKHAAASEMHRVLCPAGRLIASTWRPVTDCIYFGMICEVLNAIGEPEIANMMRVPFDFMPEPDLETPFHAAGFVDVKLGRQELDMVFDGGMAQAIDLAYATPIGPRLRGLPEKKRLEFEESLRALLSNGHRGGCVGTCMVTNVITATRAA